MSARLQGVALQRRRSCPGDDQGRVGPSEQVTEPQPFVAPSLHCFVAFSSLPLTAILYAVSHAAPDWIEKLHGSFVVFDGPDGSGKTTQCQRFAQWAAAGGVQVCLVREPGGTRMGEKIRAILLDADENEAVDLTCEMLLFMASRAQLVARCIRPALADRKLVLADRFVSSTLAYQGGAGGLPLEHIRQVAQVVLGSCQPDLVVVFDVDEATAARRLVANPRRGRAATAQEPTLFSDRMELKGAEYHRAVRRAYLDQAEADPKRYAVVDAAGNADAVFARVVETLAARFKGE